MDYVPTKERWATFDQGDYVIAGSVGILAYVWSKDARHRSSRLNCRDDSRRRSFSSNVARRLAIDLHARRLYYAKSINWNANSTFFKKIAPEI